MNLFPRHNNHNIPSEVKRRLTIATIVSLLVHALILSLQFAIPGGVSGPETSSRSPTNGAPSITLTIEQVTLTPLPSPSPSTVTPALSQNTPTSPAPSAPSMAAQSPLPSSPQVPLPAESTVKAPYGVQLVPLPVTTQSPSLVRKKKGKSKSAPDLTYQRRFASAARQARAHKLVVTEIPDVIAQDVLKDDHFVVAVRDPDEVKKEDAPQDIAPRTATLPMLAQSDSQTETLKEEKIPLPPAVSDSVPASVARYEADDSARQKADASRLQRMHIPTVATNVDTSERDRILQQLNEQNREQSEQLRREQLAAALKEQLEKEEAARRAQQEATNAAMLAQADMQRSENMRQVDEDIQRQLQLAQRQRELERKERLRALDAKRQENEEREEREERERLALQEAEIKRQQQAKMLAQQQAAQAAQLAQVAQAAQAAQRAQAAVAAAMATQREAVASAVSTQANANLQAVPRPSSSDDDIFGSGMKRGEADSGNNKSALTLPKNLLRSDLATRALDSSRGLGLLPGNPPAPMLDEKARRHTILNSLERNVQLRMYADNWKQKIERNGNLNYSQRTSSRVRADPLVSVAIRSDGSVEQITILRSSGREEIDQAVRNIVRINARYAAFPPEIAAQYDVLEIRRIWSFDDNLKLIEELR